MVYLGIGYVTWTFTADCNKAIKNGLGKTNYFFHLHYIVNQQYAGPFCQHIKNLYNRRNDVFDVTYKCMNGKIVSSFRAHISSKSYHYHTNQHNLAPH